MEALVPCCPPPLLNPLVHRHQPQQPASPPTTANQLINRYDAAKAQLADVVDDYYGKLRRREAVDPAKRKAVTVIPKLAPDWAKEKYGSGLKPVKADALEYLPEVR